MNNMCICICICMRVCMCVCAQTHIRIYIYIYIYTRIYIYIYIWNYSFLHKLNSFQDRKRETICWRGSKLILTPFPLVETAAAITKRIVYLLSRIAMTPFFRNSHTNTKATDVYCQLDVRRVFGWMYETVCYSIWNACKHHWPLMTIC